MFGAGRVYDEEFYESHEWNRSQLFLEQKCSSKFFIPHSVGGAFRALKLFELQVAGKLGSNVGNGYIFLKKLIRTYAPANNPDSCLRN